MNRSGKILRIILLPVILAFSLSCSVFANAPAPEDHLTVYLSALPSDAVYADLLVRMDPSDSNYVSDQQTSWDVPPSAEILSYSEDGYYSFTFHYRDAKSNIIAERYNDTYHTVTFCKGTEEEGFLTQYEKLCMSYGDVKIAVLDENFDLITVSPSFVLPEDDTPRFFYGDVYFEIAASRVDVPTGFNAYYTLIGGFVSMQVLFFSVLLEMLVAFFFRLRGKKLLEVFLVNLGTQFAMRLLYFALPFSYWIETAVLEILVYSGEFLIYKKRWCEIGTGKIVMYTIVANTISLLLGVLLDCYLLA